MQKWQKMATGTIILKFMWCCPIFYILVINGRVTIGGISLNTRDAIGVSDIAEIAIYAQADSSFLIIEVSL